MLPKKYSFSNRNDINSEPIASVYAWSRLEVAKHFAQLKKLTLKQFLTIFKINRHQF